MYKFLVLVGVVASVATLVLVAQMGNQLVNLFEEEEEVEEVTKVKEEEKTIIEL